MADKKISQLTALSAANVASATDVLAIVDTSATETKKITAKDLIDGALNGGTANGVLYLNGSKVATSGSALVFDGTRFFVGTTTTSTSSTQSGEIYSTGAVGFMLTNTTAANFPVSIKNEGSSGTRNLIRFYEGPAGGTSRASVSLDGSNYLTFDTNNFIINTGNLGIGTSSPNIGGYGANSRVLTIQGVSGSYAITEISSNSANTDGTYIGRLDFSSAGQAAGYENCAAIASFLSGSTSTKFGSVLQFFTRADNSGLGAPVERLRIDSSGNLFCGGTTGSSRLNLQTATSSSADSNYITLYNAGENVGHINWINGNGDIARITGTKTGSGASANDGILTFSTSTDAVLAERARITSGGYSKFSDNGTYLGSTGTYHEFYQSADATGLQVYTSNSSTYTSNVLKVDGERATTNSTYNLGNFRNGNGTGQCIIRDSGNIVNISGTYGTISDARLKQDIVDAPSQWDDLKAVRFRKYRMKTDVEADPNAPALLGVVAQELEQVCPSLVDDGEVKSVKSSILLMKAAVALQEAMARIEQLEADVAAMKGAA
jgi:hypothetical protein